MKRICGIIILLLIFFNASLGQEKFISSHFYANPYLYNPAFAGEEYRPSLFVSYRRQWMGIEGAPASANMTFHAPLGFNLALGVNATNDRRGVLNTSGGLITFAYKAAFNPEHFLKFGLSGGLITRGVSEELLRDPRYQNDPAIQAALENTLFLDGQFGFNYHLKGLNLGFTLPRLFNNELFSENNFEKGALEPLNAYQIMLHYQSPNKLAPVTFEPYLVYRIQPDNKKQFEGTGIIRIQNTVWLGASYRQDYGLTALGGITINDQLHFGYSYDVTANPMSGFMNGSHEIMLKLNFGEERRPKKRERTLVKETDPYQEYLDNLNTSPAENTTVEETPPADTTRGEITDYSGPTTVKAGNHILDLKQGHYVVVGVFGSLEAAENHSMQLFETGYYTKYGYSSAAKYYYVYIYYSLTDKREAEAARNNYNKSSLFQNVWVLTVE